MHFSVLDPEKDMATIIKILTKNDCHIQNVNVEKASLEDVFKRRDKMKGLKLTYEGPIISLRHFTAKFEMIA